MATKCAVCELGPGVISRIRSLLAEGEAKENVAMLFSLQVDDISRHMDGCIKPPRSRVERTRELLDDLETAVSDAYSSMIGATRGLAGLQAGYARIVSEYRATLAEYEKLQKPEDVVQDLTERVINPLIKEIIRGATEELDTIRTQCQQYNVPAEIANKLVEESFGRQVARLKLAIQPAVKNMSKYLGIKEENTPEVTDIDQPTVAKSGLN